MKKCVSNFPNSWQSSTVDNNCYTCEHWIWSVWWPHYLQSSSERQHLAVWSQDQRWSIGWMAAEGQDLICSQPLQWHKQDCLCYIQTNSNHIWLVGVSQQIVRIPGRTYNNLVKVSRGNAQLLFSSSQRGSVYPMETTEPLQWLIYTRLNKQVPWCNGLFGQLGDQMQSNSQVLELITSLHLNQTQLLQ